MTSWDHAYRSDVAPPWEIGTAQPVFVQLAESGELRGRVLDVGCGTGENALMLAARGLEVVGVDIASTAIARAQSKAADRGLRAEFHVWNVLELSRLVERIGTFDSALDSGMFHTLSDEDRPRHVAAVASAVRPGGTLNLMCFSEDEPDWGGPRRVMQAELREVFSGAAGWSVQAIRPARFATLMGSEGAHAWLATIRRIEPAAEGS